MHQFQYRSDHEENARLLLDILFCQTSLASDSMFADSLRWLRTFLGSERLPNSFAILRMGLQTILRQRHSCLLLGQPSCDSVRVRGLVLFASVLGKVSDLVTKRWIAFRYRDGN